jgi:hypothetical protein
MLYSRTFKTSAAQCLLPLALLLGAGVAQAGTVAPTGYNVSYVQCRSTSQAIQYAQVKGAWTSLSSSGASQKFTEQGRDDWSIYLVGSTGKTVQIDLHQGVCLISGAKQSFMVDVSAAL